MPEDGKPKSATVGDLTYDEFYRAMMDREHLQVSREEAVWSEDGATPERPVEVLLNFGCNVRQSPHLQREAVAVLEALRVDFAAVAGQKYCCGKIYKSYGFDDTAGRVLNTSVKRMSAYEPTRTIQWCSACEMQFSDAVVSKIPVKFTSEALAKFLVERIDELGDDVPWESEVKVKTLVHGHLGEHAVRDRHPALAIQLLERIPGVEFVSYAKNPALDVCDNAGPAFASIDAVEYRATQQTLELYLAESGADTLVTMYHGCTRELSKFASDRLRVRHYISVLAEALGVGKPDRFSEYWRLGDPEKVKEASRPNWESWGISEEDALRLAHKYFVPSYARNAPECPCNGACTRTGATWLLPHTRTEG